MKIGLLAFQNAINFGAVLQMYSLKKRLEKLGHDVEVINYFSKSTEMGNGLNRTPYLSKNTNLRLLKYSYLKIKFMKTQKMWEKKYHKFKSFRDIYLNISKNTYHSIHDFNKEIHYDTIIVGSDQVWNPNITDGFDPVFFCDFNENIQINKVAYAASCGSVSTIKENSEEFYSLIKNFDSISVREEELNNFIELERMSNRTLDPSLLTTKEEYNEIAIIPSEKDYLLIYRMQENKELYEVAKNIAAKRNLQIIELGFSPFKKDPGIKYIEDASPVEFLGLFKEASFVVTNSFHGTAFSIIYNKQFYTVPHRSVGQRMINLLELLNLNNRLILKADQINFEELKEIDFEPVNLLLKVEIDKSMNYLENSLFTEGVNSKPMIYQTANEN